MRQEAVEAETKRDGGAKADLRGRVDRFTAVALGANAAAAVLLAAFALTEGDPKLAIMAFSNLSVAFAMVREP